MDSGVYSDFILCIESLTEISKALGGSGERNNVPDTNAKNKTVGFKDKLQTCLTAINLTAAVSRQNF